MGKVAKKMSVHAQAAKAIRAELKNAFKDVKFSVTSECFSMGNAVRISWTNGPSEKEVMMIAGKYQYGHFNGMTDCYEHSSVRDDLPQAKFVTTTRYEGKIKTKDATTEDVKKAIEDATGLKLGDKFEFIK